jgi:hypothetical protein
MENNNKGYVEVINTLKPKNNQKFAVVEAQDVDFNGKALD